MANAAVAPSPCWARRRPGISPPVCTAQPPSGRHADEEGPETRLGATIGVRGRPRVRISGLAYRHCLTGTARPIPAAPSGRRLRRASPTSLLPPRECASPLGQPAGLGWQGGWERGCQSLSRQRSTQSRLCSESGSAPFDSPPRSSAFSGRSLFYICSPRMQDVERSKATHRGAGVGLRRTRDGGALAAAQPRERSSPAWDKTGESRAWWSADKGLRGAERGLGAPEDPPRSDQTGCAATRKGSSHPSSDCASGSFTNNQRAAEAPKVPKV
jgi:hypothetical protein